MADLAHQAMPNRFEMSAIPRRLQFERHMPTAILERLGPGEVPFITPVSGMVTSLQSRQRHLCMMWFVVSTFDMRGMCNQFGCSFNRLQVRASLFAFVRHVPHGLGCLAAYRHIGCTTVPIWRPVGFFLRSSSFISRRVADFLLGGVWDCHSMPGSPP